MSITAIDRLLAEQADLTAVEQFSYAHDCRLPNSRESHYRNLIPLNKPAHGEQYAFEVDLDKCTGCKACVSACHSLNGLQDEEMWREVGLLVGGHSRAPRQQTVTSACHHCADPGCLEGCPVLAYEKDADTGVVRHLDDQCIGCQYCILKCPYEVPKYSKKMGIVRKCDLCHSRLAVGEAPACVQACPTSAISIRLIKTDEIRERAANELFLPDSPDPRITNPGTVYISAKPLSERAIAADHHTPEIQHTHWPLVFMLVLTQAGVGFLTGNLGAKAHPFSAVIGAILIQLGLGASVLHLGQPFKAWRAFLGWRTSWLSREIIVLGALGALSLAAAASGYLDYFPSLKSLQPLLQPKLIVAAVTVGWLGVLCSGWVYHDTHRAVWNGFLSFGRFFLTTGLFAALVAGVTGVFLGLAGAKLLFEFLLMCRGSGKTTHLNDIDRSARLLRGPLKALVFARFAAGGLAVILCANSQITSGMLVLLVAELLERALFFKAGVAQKMPGQAS